MKEKLPITENINAWLGSGACGISSHAIVTHLTGVNFSGRWGLRTPCDPSDLRRCAKLLNDCPEVRARFHEMAEVSPQWAALVPIFDELVDLMKKEAGGNAPRGETYKRMKDIGL